jgi:vacuolar-type H+-ATPase subunit E/Vma4
MVGYMKSTPELDSFLDNIIENGCDESEDILKRVEMVKRSKLEAAEAQFADEYAKTVKSSVEAIKAKYRKAVSQKSVEYKRELYRHREELIDSLMSDTLSAVSNYAASQTYENRLFALCAKAMKEMDGRPFRIFLRPEDTGFADRLKSAAPGADFAEGSFRLGGIQARSTDGRIYLDETFDSIKENLRANFSSYFPLTGSD